MSLEKTIWLKSPRGDERSEEIEEVDEVITQYAREKFIPIMIDVTNQVDFLLNEPTSDDVL